MRKPISWLLLAFVPLFAAPAYCAPAGAVGALLQHAVEGSWRSAANRARDRYRHPVQTLEFFGLRPDMTVVELEPGMGWYTEILAPVLHDHGHLIELGLTTGFRLVAVSEINANPKDNETVNVHRLPPDLVGPRSEHARMRAIGESDRMTLKFVKPRGCAPSAMHGRP